MVASPMLQEAYDLIKNGHKTTAQDVLVRYLDAHPDDPEAWWLLANVVDERERREKSLKRVLKLNPEHVQARRALARMIADRAAVRNPVELMDDNPLVAYPVLSVAYNHIKDGRRRSAQAMLTGHLNNNPDDSAAWWLLANAVDSPDLREKSLKRVLKLNPAHEQARRALARYYTDEAVVRKPVELAQHTYPLDLRFKIIALAPQIIIMDATGKQILFVRQKIWNLREDVRIFRDESKTEELFRITANQLIDMGLRYHFRDTQTNQRLGAIKQNGQKTIWRSRYDIEDQLDQAMHQLTEDNPMVKITDAVLGEIPVLGFFTGYLLRPSFTLMNRAEKPIMRIIKEPAYYESKYRIELLERNITAEQEKRLLLGIMMMIQLTRSRG
ncbi:MAG: tetratricopeptide repeat protein [Chloroflexota bacterium]